MCAVCKLWQWKTRGFMRHISATILYCWWLKSCIEYTIWHERATENWILEYWRRAHCCPLSSKHKCKMLAFKCEFIDRTVDEVSVDVGMRSACIESFSTSGGLIGCLSLHQQTRIHTSHALTAHCSLIWQCQRSWGPRQRHVAQAQQDASGRDWN